MTAQRKTPKQQRRRAASVKSGALLDSRAPLSAGLMFSVPLPLPTYWTPEQALAVFELIDDLRERIWCIYAASLQELTRQERQPVPVDPIPADTDSQPF